MRSMKLHQPKRGVSTIVGTVFFLVLMVAAFSVYFMAIDTQNQFVDTQKLVSSTEKKKSQEDFSIVASTNSTDNHRLGVGVINLGPDSIEIVDIWLVNKTNPTTPSQRHELDPADAYIPSSYSSNILETKPLYLADDTSYQIKAVSSLGTIRTTELNVGGANNLLANLVTIPPNPLTGETITVALFVVNTGDGKLLDVTPNVMQRFGSNITTKLPGFPQPPKTDLGPDDMIIFIWNYKVEGAPGSLQLFRNSVNATEMITGFKVQSNEADDVIKIIDPSSGTIGLTILNDDLVNKPGIFMIIPGPFGIPDHSAIRGLWGMNVVNPTPDVMNVNRLTISLLTPRANPQDDFFSDGGGSYCDPIRLEPNIGTFTCPEDNQLEWSNASGPFSIPPFSVQEFLAMARPGSLAGTNNQLDTVITHGVVHTSIGEFGKAGYATSMTDTEDMGVVNLFLSSDIETNDTSTISATVLGIKNGTSQQFNVTLADFEYREIINGTWSPPEPKIAADARITINIPKLWNVTNSTINGFGNFNTTYQQFFDGSSQIIAIHNGTELIDGVDTDALTVQFNATAPVVNSTKLFVMYILADGQMEETPGANIDISPLLEVILQVVP